MQGYLCACLRDSNYALSTTGPFADKNGAFARSGGLIPVELRWIGYKRFEAHVCQQRRCLRCSFSASRPKDRCDLKTRSHHKCPSVPCVTLAGKFPATPQLGLGRLRRMDHLRCRNGFSHGEVGFPYVAFVNH